MFENISMDNAEQLLIDSIVSHLVKSLDQTTYNIGIVPQNNVVAYDPMVGFVVQDNPGGNEVPDNSTGDGDGDSEGDDEYIRAQSESIAEYQPSFTPAMTDIISHFQTVDKFEHTSCPLCLDDEQQPMGLVRTPCHHIFHTECLRNWLKEGNFCPVCRNIFKS
jgi:hypothetical protein